jgi:hypothetical protein
MTHGLVTAVGFAMAVAVSFVMQCRCAGRRLRPSGGSSARRALGDDRPGDRRRRGAGEGAWRYSDTAIVEVDSVDDIAEYKQPGSNGLALDGRVARPSTSTAPAGSPGWTATRSPCSRIAIRVAASIIPTTSSTAPMARSSSPTLHSGCRRCSTIRGRNRRPMASTRDGELTLITDELRGPNGIAFSPDERAPWPVWVGGRRAGRLKRLVLATGSSESACSASIRGLTKCPVASVGRGPQSKASEETCSRAGFGRVRVAPRPSADRPSALRPVWAGGREAGRF